VRLGFAIAVHNDPQVLLIDEVLAVGDLAFQRKCFDKMKELKASGRTIVLISHSMPQIESLCERAIMLRKGQLVADGPPREVAEKYIEVADAGSVRSEFGGDDSGIAITGVRLLDRNGKPTTRAELGGPMSFDIEYDARRPFKNVLFGFHIDRGHLRVYDSNTRTLGVDLGVVNGKGILRCEIPALSLMPNSYGVQVVIYSEDERALSHVMYPHMFSIFAPHDLRDIGCALDDEPRRGIVFGSANWRKLPVQPSTAELARKVS